MSRRLLQSLDALPSTDVGGKARNLARLKSSGLPVPPAFVLASSAFEGDAVPAGDWEGVVQQTSRLGYPVAVRSSASIEDTATGAAPGLFESVLDVSDAKQLADAIGVVRASRNAPVVASYLSARALRDQSVALSVIVQKQVKATRSGVVYTRPPGSPDSDHVLVDVVSTAGQCTTLTVDRQRPHAEHDDLSGELLESIVGLALSAEEAIDAGDGADVEWVVDDASNVWLVQARPIIHRRVSTSVAPPADLFAFSREEPSVIWRWDVTHNPDPMSPAQIALVELMDSLAIAPYRMKALGGYLYFGERSELPAAQAASTEQLEHLFSEVVVPACDGALAEVESRPPDLRSALGAYQRVYAAYAATLTPVVSATRRRLVDVVKSALPASDGATIAAELLSKPSSLHLANRLSRAARGEESRSELQSFVGPMSSAWDVAAPTYGEDPAVVGSAIEDAKRRQRSESPAERARTARLEVLAALGPDEQIAFESILEAAELAAAIAEIDDQMFYRAQCAVRRALLDIARRWNLESEDDIFYVADLDWLLEQDAAAHVPRERVAEHAEVGRRRRALQQTWSMPTTIKDGAAAFDLPHAPGDLWRGRGTGGRATGVAVRLEDLSAVPEIGDGSVVVARALSPALIISVRRAVALISAYGGLLGHGAAMARELGIPCITGCRDAWANIASGDRLWVDGDAGLIVRTHPHHDDGPTSID